MSEKTIAEMQAELKDAGYQGEWLGGWGHQYEFTFIFEEGLEVSHWDDEIATKTAYRHLQTTRKLAALEEFVKEVAAVKTKGVSEGTLCHDMLNFIDSAKELLAKSEESSDE